MTEDNQLVGEETQKQEGIEEMSVEGMAVEEKANLEEPEATGEPTEENNESPTTEGEDEEDDESLDEKEKLPFPTAAVVRLMKHNMDKEKMIKKDVKVSMNKWLGDLCAKVSKEMNKIPYTMMHRHEFEQAKRKYEDLENFDKEKIRILAHLNAIKEDIKRLERDLGKKDEEEIKSEHLE